MDGGTGGQRVRGRDREERRWPLSPLFARDQNGSLNSFNLQREGGKLKDLVSFDSSWQSALICAVFFPFLLDHLYLFPLSLLFVSSVSPFSLPLQQVRGIHSDIRLAPSAFCWKSQRDTGRERKRWGGV
ncbi:hypothetical protein XENOCAPTIV_023125 [Xenoophorus captivus]|uniref:Transmembrane protein n=1 Tax=Xenoophorus captivus TaxID=1517983 RepID=A0ABV0R5S7_9TELE